MKKGTIYRNKWAGFETYFIYLNSVSSSKMEAKKVGGLKIVNINGKWELDKAEFYKNDLQDSEHFPIVGHININEVLIKAILGAINKW